MRQRLVVYTEKRRLHIGIQRLFIFRIIRSGEVEQRIPVVKQGRGSGDRVCHAVDQKAEILRYESILIGFVGFLFSISGDFAEDHVIHEFVSDIQHAVAVPVRHPGGDTHALTSVRHACRAVSHVLFIIVTVFLSLLFLRSKVKNHR